MFDNAQWLDESSRELIMRALVLGDQFPCLLCLSRQPANEGPDDSPSEARRIDLGPLDPVAALELARVVCDADPLPHHRLLEAVERSGGRPLFLISLIEAAMAGEDLPASVEDLVNSRIDALDQNARRVLRCAAVIGARFRPEVLESGIGDEVAIADDPGVWDRLTEYLGDDVNGEKVFRQNLYRDVAYAGLPYHRRRAMHLRVGHVIESHGAEDHAQLLSRHFVLGEDYERAWHYSVLAADGAAGKYAHVDATELYEQALHAAKRLRHVPAHELARVAEARGIAAESAGLYADADAAFADARRRTVDDSVALGRLLRRRGLLRERNGSYSVALRWLSRGMKHLDAAPAGDATTIERARLMLAYAGVRYRQGHYHHCVTNCHETLALDGIAPAEQAHARYLLCLAYAHLGDAASEHEGRRALAIYDTLGDQLGRANVLNNLGMNAYYRGEWDAALEHWSRSEEARDACGDIVGSATQTNNLGEIYSDQGKWDDARRCFTEALRIWQGARYGVGVALASSNLGRLEARTGRHDAATELLRRAVEGFEAIGAGAFALEARARSAENLVFQADARSAEVATQLVAAAEATAGATVIEAMLHRIAGYAAWQEGDRSRAARAFAASLDRSRAAGAPYEEALTLRAIGELEGDTEALATAAATLERMGVVTTPLVPVPARGRPR
jgi:tetratricopeptide (TPR) repeat protein